MEQKQSYQLVTAIIVQQLLFTYMKLKYQLLLTNRCVLFENQYWLLPVNNNTL